MSNATLALKAPIPPTPEMLERLATLPGIGKIRAQSKAQAKARTRSVPQPSGIVKPKARKNANRSTLSTPVALSGTCTESKRETGRQLEKRLDGELLELRKGMVTSRRDPRFKPSAIRAITSGIRQHTNRAGALFVATPGRGPDIKVALLLAILRRRFSRVKTTTRSLLQRVKWEIDGTVPAKAINLSSIPALLAWYKRVSQSLAWDNYLADGGPGEAAQLALEDNESRWDAGLHVFPELEPMDLAILDLWREETAEVVERGMWLDNRQPRGDYEDLQLYDEAQRDAISFNTCGPPPNLDAYSPWVSAREGMQY